MSWSDHLSRPDVATRLKRPTRKHDGPPYAFCSVLLRMGFTYALSVTRQAVVSYTAFPPLPAHSGRLYFCCTVLGVTSTGRYPASCPMKPGLSSPAAFRFCSRDHSVLLKPCLTILPSLFESVKCVFELASTSVMPIRQSLRASMRFIQS